LRPVTRPHSAGRHPPRLDDSTCSGSTRGAEPPVWPLLLAAALAAVWIDLGVIHAYHQADTLIPVLVSLYHWTPFYWEQGRLGMLVPLLATPFTHPLVNLLVQVGLGILGGLAAVVLVARLAVRDPIWPVVAGGAVALLLAVVPFRVQATYFLAQPYGVSLALCAGGLLLVARRDGRPPGRWRLALGLALVCAAHWVNAAVGLPIAVLVLVRALATRQRPLAGEPAVALLLLATGLAVGVALQQTLGGRGATGLTVIPLDTWPEGWRRLLAGTWRMLGPHVGPTVLAGAALAGLALLVVPPARRGLRVALPAMLGGTAAALVSGGAMGTLGWVAENRFSWRYMLPSALFLGIAVVAWIIAPLAAWRSPQLRAGAQVVALALVLLGVARHAAVPSLAEVRRALDEKLGERTADVLKAGATHVAGHYWRVWPAVFHANLALHERGERRVVWGLTWRSRPAWKRWRGMPAEDVRVALAPGEPDVPFYLEIYGLAPVVVVEKHATIWLVRPTRGLRPGEAVLEDYTARP
jgi:hypothetical protein